MAQVPVPVWFLLGALAGALVALLLVRYRSATNAPQLPTACEPAERPKPMAVKETISISRPSNQSVEGLEIRYDSRGLVRSVCVGAMNLEHKELLLTMDTVVWSTLPNSHKQEVLAAARSTWAAKMCADGPDIAYVIVKTESGDVVGRAGPRSVTIF